MSDEIQVIAPVRAITRLASECVIALRAQHLSKEERAEILKALKWCNTPAYYIDGVSWKDLTQLSPGTLVMGGGVRDRVCKAE